MSAHQMSVLRVRIIAMLVRVAGRVVPGSQGLPGACAAREAMCSMPVAAIPPMRRHVSARGVTPRVKNPRAAS